MLVVILIQHHTGHSPGIGLTAEEQRHSVVKDPLVLVGNADVDEDNRQDHVAQVDELRRQRQIEALVRVPAIIEPLARGDVGGDRDVLALCGTDPVDDVDVQRRVSVLVVVVRVELDRHPGEPLVRGGLDRCGGGSDFGADAVVVAVVLVEDDAREAVHVRVEWRQHRAVVEGDRERVVELPCVAGVGEDVHVHLGQVELLERDRLGAQLQSDGVRRLVVERVPVVRVHRTAEVGVLAEPVGVVRAVRLDVLLERGRTTAAGGVTGAVLDEDVQQGVVVQVVVKGVEVDRDRRDDGAGVVAEVGEHETGRLERAVTVAQGDPDAGVAEADDVGLAVTVQIGQQTRM